MSDDPWDIEINLDQETIDILQRLMTNTGLARKELIKRAMQEAVLEHIQQQGDDYEFAPAIRRSLLDS